MSLPPALVLVLLVTLLSAFLYHACFGRSTRGLLVTLVAALTGMVLGEAVARWLGSDWPRIGTVHLLHGLVGAWLCMALASRRVA